MSIRLQRDPDNTDIHPSKLRVGQLAEIISSAKDFHVGDIVQRHGDSLLIIGSRYASYLPPEGSNFRVRPIPNGPCTFLIEDNE